MNIIIKKNLSKIVAFTAATVLVLSPGISDNAVSAHPIPEEFLSDTTFPDALHDLFAYTDKDSLRNNLCLRSRSEILNLLPAISQTFAANFYCVNWIIKCMMLDPTTLFDSSDKSSEDIETITKQANAALKSADSFLNLNGYFTPIGLAWNYVATRPDFEMQNQSWVSDIGKALQSGGCSYEFFATSTEYVDRDLINHVCDTIEQIKCLHGVIEQFI